MAFHSADGTDEKSTAVPYFRLSSESHTQALIRYKDGYRGHTDVEAVAVSVSAEVTLIKVS
jgi:hypothetical protein